MYCSSWTLSCVCKVYIVVFWGLHCVYASNFVPSRETLKLHSPRIVSLSSGCINQTKACSFTCEEMEELAKWAISRQFVMVTMCRPNYARPYVIRKNCSININMVCILTWDRFPACYVTQANHCLDSDSLVSLHTVECVHLGLRSQQWYTCTWLMFEPQTLSSTENTDGISDVCSDNVSIKSRIVGFHSFT